ncbi:MAG: hypothetical protein H6739_15295 [Alphaproteobacteria bacterium]|nr:hypothetical protein [Alphaproteobacteria bacterium]
MAALLLADLRLQWRQGFYAAYALVCVSYALVLGALPDELRRWLVPLIVYSDPAVLGFFFVGGLTLLERGEGVLQPLFVTPVRVEAWLASKCISLTALALSVVAALGVLGETNRWGLLMSAAALTSVCFVLLGVIAVSRFETINQYIGGAVLWATPLVAPVLPMVAGWSPGWMLAWPTCASLALFQGAFAEAPMPWGTAAVCLLSLAAWTGLAWVWAVRWFSRYTLGLR